MKGITFLVLNLISLVNSGSLLLDEIINKWNEHIQWADVSDARNYYSQIKTYLKDQQPSQQQLRKILRLYAQYIMYGLDEDMTQHIDFTKVFYYLKQSAQLGDSEAYALLGMLGSYKLDGGFNLYTNLEALHEQYKKNNDSGIQIKLQKLKQLESFVSYHHLSEPLVDFYFASLQGSEYASLALSYKYALGIGVDQNCSNSVLFMHPILEKNLITHPTHDKLIFQNRRLDNLLFNTELFILQSQFLDQENTQIFEDIDIITKESMKDVFTLAQNYLYGANGLKRNYEKAYELFSKIASEKKSAKSLMAQMIVEGIAPEKSMSYAFKLFQEAALSNDSRALNGLGYMHLNGIATPKNLNKAINYFKKSADLGFGDGLYNYGSLHLLPSSQELQRNVQLAIQYLNLAVTKGHHLAQLTLALLYLDGVDLFYSCELAQKLMQQASTRLFPAKLMKVANEFYAKSLNSAAFVKYLELAQLGYLTPTSFKIFLKIIIFLVNAAILADQLETISNDDIEFDKINQRLSEDDLYLFLQQNKNSIIQNDDPFGFIFKEYLSLVDNNRELLIDLLKLDQNKTIGQYIAFKLYGYAKLEGDAYALLRLGDFSYYGIYQKQNYQEAYDSYYTASRRQDSPPALQAYALFNLGYMSALGIGKQVNETEALIYFNASLLVDPIIPGISPKIILIAVKVFCLISEHDFTKLFILFDQFMNMIFNILIENILIIIAILMFQIFILLIAYKLYLTNLKKMSRQ